MKITVKTTQQKIFQVDVDPSESIAALKAKIQESQGHPAASQKIIYSGQILTDDKTVESCGIKEKDFLVLMVAKPKPAAAAVSSTAPVAPAVAAAPPQPASASTPAPDPPAPAAQEPPQPAAAAPAPAFGDPSAFLSGDGLQAAISNMVDMGFPRDQVLRAMRASFNNADRAVEYLMTGIPSHLEAEEPRNPPVVPAPAQSQSTPATAPQTPAQQTPSQPQNLFQLAQQQQQAGSGGPVMPGAAPAGQLNLEALRDNPQIQQLRQQLAQNPDRIQPLIQQLATQNPAIAQMIAQNPEALLQLLGIQLEDEEEMEMPPGAHVVRVTEEEREAIQRLEALGFPPELVLEAYLACDKNEEMAANLLFDRSFDN